ncbi:MAG: ribonuclease H-like domain-containing protein [Pseudomonadota bacterium]
MSKNIIVFDIETQNAFSDVGGRQNLTDLKISVLGAYFYKTNEYQIFEEKDLKEFEKTLQDRPLLVGFNSRKFDCPILQQYLTINLKNMPQFDILEELTKILGHRVSLDSVAQATLNKQKIGSGLDAIRYWNNGEIDKLKKYCLEDVRITKEVFEYGANKSEVFFISKFGNAKKQVAVNWKIEHPEENEESSKQQSFSF